MLKTQIQLFLLIPLLCLFSVSVKSQSISGKVIDENNQTVPYANVFLKDTEIGTTTNGNGEFFILVMEGNYSLVVSHIGYKTVDMPVVIKEGNLRLDIILEYESRELDQVVVKAKRKDPAYEIIQLAIENREKNSYNMDTFICNIYIKAIENRDFNTKENDNPIKDPMDLSIDDFELENKKDTSDALPDISIHESQIELHIQKPSGIKEIKKASKTVGTPTGLFIPKYYKDQIDFYEGLVKPSSVTETPWISPLNRTSILSYKFKLEEVYYEGTQLVYNIKIIPRKSGNSTISGNIHINDSIWNIRKLDVYYKKGGLLFYDEFQIIQDYEKQGEKWILTRQEFNYSTKSGKKNYEGNTVMRYSDFNFSPVFPEKHFSNEVGYAEDDAYEKDTTFWNLLRPEALTAEQLKVIAIDDSIKAYQSSNHYIDSMNALYNKIKFADIIYYGVGFRNREKERSLRISSLGELININVGGLRINPSTFYNKILPSGKRLSIWGAPNYGIRNKDLKGSLSLYYNYNPFNFSSAGFRINKDFDFINQNDAYLEMIRRSNFYETTSFNIWHTFEPTDGIRVYYIALWNYRNSVENYKFGTFTEKFLDNQLPTTFESHSAFVTTLSLSYTHKQIYYREPKRKIILGSKYPTITLSHTKGWNSIFKSILDYDLLTLRINQRFDVRSFGNSIYSVQMGQFLNHKSVRILDYKRFRRGDPFLFSDPKSTFQLLDESFEITSPYFEAHYIHHFNGLLINNIPVIKKLKLRSVAGGGVLYLPEESYQYVELFAGMERVFKLGPRRRLKIGAYGVSADSNRSRTQLDWKISFDIIDTWRTNWNF